MRITFEEAELLNQTGVEIILWFKPVPYGIPFVPCGYYTLVED